MIASKVLGNDGEQYALELLEAHGYTARLLRNNYQTYDIEVVGPRPFLVSVKASKDKQHVRLGAHNSVERLSAGNFVFAFMPTTNSKQIEFRPGGYRLLIVPAEIARKDALAIMRAYREEHPSASSFSYILKGYSKRRQHPEVWARWAAFEDAWDLLAQPPAAEAKQPAV